MNSPVPVAVPPRSGVRTGVVARTGRDGVGHLARRVLVPGVVEHQGRRPDRAEGVGDADAAAGIRPARPLPALWGEHGFVGRRYDVLDVWHGYADEVTGRALPGEELDDAEAALGELHAFAALGGRAVVQWTPWGMGRRVGELPALARASGVHVITATGLHQARHYDRDELDRVRGGLAGLFVLELTSGPVKAGLIKVAGAYHRLDEHARHVMAAAAEAHHATGAPIGVHLEAGTAALDVLDLLCGRHGVDPRSVILEHVHRFPDVRIHRYAAERGAFLAFDGPSRAHQGTDRRLLDSLTALVDAGHAHQILLGGDTVTRTARSTADGPGMPFLLSGLRPQIVKELGPGAASAIFTENPARAFAAHWRQPDTVPPPLDAPRGRRPPIREVRSDSPKECPAGH